MDIEILLHLQYFRNLTDNLLSPLMLWMSNFAVGFWPVAMACMVYWVFDRRAGKRILAGFGLGVLANGVLKLTFRITRPWLRDGRVQPYGDSKVSATGYSFPSGHSTFATALFGGMAWWQRKRNAVLSMVLLAAMLLTLFSRNYLGVHTPQDVLIGSLTTMLMMFFAYQIEEWTDRDPKRDLYVVAGGLVLCAVLALYYRSINIRAVYDEAGTLSVDPVKMKADSFEGIGFISAFVVCRFFERRYFHFDTRLNRKDRFIVGVFLLIPLHWWCTNIFTIVSAYDRGLARFTTHAGIVVYALIVAPLILEKIRLPQWMREENVLQTED